MLPLEAFDNQMEFQCQFRYFIKPEMELKEYETLQRLDYVNIDEVAPTNIASQFNLAKFAAI